jgi:hypothetical protein
VSKQRLMNVHNNVLWTLYTLPLENGGLLSIMHIQGSNTHLAILSTSGVVI